MISTIEMIELLIPLLVVLKFNSSAAGNALQSQNQKLRRQEKSNATRVLHVNLNVLRKSKLDKVSNTILPCTTTLPVIELAFYSIPSSENLILGNGPLDVSAPFVSCLQSATMVQSAPDRIPVCNKHK